MTRRPGFARNATERTLKRLTVVESAAMTSPLPAPISVAILSPVRCGMEIQSAPFQLVMRSLPHSMSTTLATRSRARLVSAPSELPSR